MWIVSKMKSSNSVKPLKSSNVTSTQFSLNWAKVRNWGIPRMTLRYATSAAVYRANEETILPQRQWGSYLLKRLRNGVNRFGISFILLSSSYYITFCIKAFYYLISYASITHPINTQTIFFSIDGGEKRNVYIIYNFTLYITFYFNSLKGRHFPKIYYST